LIAALIAVAGDADIMFSLMVLPSTNSFPMHLPRWAYMWGSAVAIYCLCKWLTWKHSPHRHAPIGRQLGYLLGWPGMDAIAFFDSRRRPAQPSVGEWIFAGSKFSLGLSILYEWIPHLPPMDPYWLGWFGMTGIILCLHFGSFHLISCAWRRAGVEARPLMNWPLAAVRLSDYWGRRWNTAFSDLTQRFLFRRLTRRLGGPAALLVGFFASGLIHDAVISIPAGGGYGGPTLFFILQAIGLFIERSSIGRRMGLGVGFRGWLFTMGFILVPARLLFHRPFVVGVIVPFMHAIGASHVR
jgi:hypothetical protein